MLLATLLTLLPQAPAEAPDRAPAAPVVRFLCRTEAQVRGADILLGDVADIGCDDQALAARLAELRIATRPAFGFTRLVTSQDVRQWAIQAGLAGDRIDLRGARETVVHSLVAVLEPDELRAITDPVLRAVLAQEPGQIECEPSAPMQRLRVPPGRRSLDVRATLRDGRLGAGTAIVDLVVVVDGKEWTKQAVHYKLRRFVDVLVVSRPIARGAQLGDHNLEVRRVESSASASPFLGAIDAVAGKVAARDMRANEKLTLAHLANPAVIRRGDPVSLVSARGRVKVAARAVAESDGAVGDRIQVVSLASGQRVQALVEGPGVVSILPLR
jgi:flagella basal body P-ring formation protein FlgA